MELPENLKTIKMEHNIKERLNLHVKRRLQQEPLHALTAVATPVVSSEKSPSRDGAETNRRKDKLKETQKTRRPYQKRTDKAIAGASALSTEGGMSETIEGGGAAGRKYYKRHKAKVVAAAGEAGCGTLSDESAAASVAGFPAAVHGNGEDDGSRDDIHDMDTKSCTGGGNNGRDKDKCPDVLGMLLNVKKRALMEDPEVREFLARVMHEIKS